MSKFTKFSKKVQRAKSLQELCDILNSYDDLVDRFDPDSPKLEEIADLTDLPVFGDPLKDTSEIYSWDNENVMYYDNEFYIKKMDKVDFEVLSEEEFTAADMCCEGQELASLGGYLDDGDELGLGAWQYEFTVRVTNQEDETQTFNIVYQPLARTDGLRAYAGYEVAKATNYGCDADKSKELEEFCNYDCDQVFSKLERRAETAAKAELERLIANREL